MHNVYDYVTRCVNDIKKHGLELGLRGARKKISDGIRYV